MARLSVNPTRMELRRLKDRLKTATRGHKLLKDKADEMVRRFIEYVKENKRLREEIERDMPSVLASFALASAQNSPSEIAQAIAMPSAMASVTQSTENVMGVDVPVLEIKRSGERGLPYSLFSASGELDDNILAMNDFTDRLLQLAQIEKTCNILALEIEKNRRRVNALEYFTIPQLEETIKYILMKLDENERSNLVRLMKVKSMAQARDEAKRDKGAAEPNNEKTTKSATTKKALQTGKKTATTKKAKPKIEDK